MAFIFQLHFRSKIENKMAETKREFSEEEFSAALVEALRNFHHDSLKVEQIECLRWVICLREDVLAVLLMGFGKSLIYQIIPTVLECLKNESDDAKKFIVCVVSPLEYVTLFWKRWLKVKREKRVYKRFRPKRV